MRLAHGLNGWVFLFGKHLHTASLVPIGETLFFPTRPEAVRMARAHGLRVSRHGKVSCA